MADEVEVPILIVGGGPTGLLMAYLASKLKVRSLVVEKYSERLPAPKAHASSPRSIEICRQFGIDTRLLRSLGTQRRDAFWVNFVENLSDDLIGVLPYERMDPEVLDDTPEMIHNIPQPEFERFIAELLRDDPNTEVRKGLAFVSCVQHEDFVVSVLEERETGHRINIRSRFVVGCDGAKSAVRSALGIESSGEESTETMMTIHFKADIRPLVGDRVGMLFWIMDPAASGFIIGYDLSDNLVLISNFDPETRSASSWTKEHCEAVLRAAMGRDVPVEVLGFRPWILSRKVAKQYRKGRVLLAGDAAHAFPPTGGLGLNCGLADVHNLAYKLAAIYHGQADESLLDTYQAERQPVADIYARQSEKNGKEIFSFLKTIGTAGIKDVAEARSNLRKSIHDPAKQPEIQAGVEGQREHFDNLNLHIGYVYGDPRPPAHASHYAPKFVIGARLPHAFIKFTQPTTTTLQPLDLTYISELPPSSLPLMEYSTLDLCAPDAFTFIVGPAYFDLYTSTALEQTLAADGIKLNVFAMGRDFDFTIPRQRTLFDEGVGMLRGGGLLVRPDQHILRHFPPAESEGVWRVLAGNVRRAVLEHFGKSVE